MFQTLLLYVYRSYAQIILDNHFEICGKNVFLKYRSRQLLQQWRRHIRYAIPNWANSRIGALVHNQKYEVVFKN